MYLVYYNNGEFKYREGELTVRKTDKKTKFDCTDGKQPGVLLRVPEKLMTLDNYDRVVIDDISQLADAKTLIIDTLISRKRDKILDMENDLLTEKCKLYSLHNIKSDI